MADLEHSSSVGGYPIIHEGNVNYALRDLNYPENMISKTFADGKFNRVFNDRDGANPKNGDILIERGPIISIYYDGWRRVYISTEQPPLVTASSFMFRTEKEALFFQNDNIPVDAQLILDTWPRTSADLYFDDPSTATGNAAEWYYNADVDGFVQPINSATIEQILSPYLLENYEMETTLSSVSMDNDALGLVVASGYYDGELMSVVAIVEPGGNSVGDASDVEINRSTFKLIFLDSITSWYTFVSNGTGLGNNVVLAKGNWGNLGKVRVKVTKNNNIVTAITTDWDGTEYLESTKITYDLQNLPRNGYKLLGPQRHGFFTNSQAESTYTDIQIRSADYSDDTNVYSLQGDKHWEYIDEEWLLVGNASDDFDGVDFIVNPYTKERFTVNDGNINFEVNNGINYNTPSFDFTGQSGDIVITTASILVNFTYSESISIEAVFNGTNSDVILSPNDEIIVRLNGSGDFYVLISTDETVNPQGGVEKTIAYRKVTYIN